MRFVIPLHKRVHPEGMLGTSRPLDQGLLLEAGFLNTGGGVKAG